MSYLKPVWCRGHMWHLYEGTNSYYRIQRRVGTDQSPSFIYHPFDLSYLTLPEDYEDHAFIAFEWLYKEARVSAGSNIAASAARITELLAKHWGIPGHLLGTQFGSTKYSAWRALQQPSNHTCGIRGTSGMSDLWADDDEEEEAIVALDANGTTLHDAP